MGLTKTGTGGGGFVACKGWEDRHMVGDFLGGDLRGHHEIKKNLEKAWGVNGGR